VENKRVELGESHLKEIKKVNGAATAIKEFIQPLEARLLIQESFAEQHEVLRIAELSRCRTEEVRTIVLAITRLPDLSKMTQEDYSAYIDGLRAERAAIEAANRLRIEAERRLAEQAIEMRRQEEEFLAKLQAEKVAENARLESNRIANEAMFAAIRADEKAEAERVDERAREVYAELKRQNEAEHAIRVIEALRLDNERAARDADAAEQKRIRDEQFAKLEAELAQANAAKQAEEAHLRRLTLAPDGEKLLYFAKVIRQTEGPGVENEAAKKTLADALFFLYKGAEVLEAFCQKENLTLP
jgi:hypothetical protein